VIITGARLKGPLGVAGEVMRAKLGPLGSVTAKLA
jgi:hypothetical protein